MQMKKALVLYKKSAYASYFLDRNSTICSREGQIPKKNLSRFLEVHDEHYRALERVE